LTKIRLHEGVPRSFFQLTIRVKIPGGLNIARTGAALVLRATFGAVLLFGVIYFGTLLLGGGKSASSVPESNPESASENGTAEAGSPLLARLESQGTLPPASMRTGPEPEVAPGIAGNYGGDLWLLAHDIDEVRVAMQYAYKGDGLLRFSPEGLPLRGHLAKSVEPSDDFRTWRITLRTGVKWSDGQPFTTSDFVWWAENVWADKSLGSVPELWRSASGPAQIEAESDTVLRVSFPDARPDWPLSLASPTGSLYLPGPRHYLEKYHPRLGDPNVIKREGAQQGLAPRELFLRKAEILNPDRPGLGPWILRTASPQGPWLAVRNPYYPVVDDAGRQLPYLDRLVFRQVSKQLQPRAITDGLASFAWRVPVDYPSLVNESQSSRYHLFPWRRLDRAGMNIVPNRRLRVTNGDRNATARAALLRQPEFRRALSLAINRQAIILAEYDGIGEPGALGPGPGDFGYDPAYARANTDYDPARANALLDGLGLTKRDAEGFRLGPENERLSFEIISRPGNVSALEFITDFWAAVGIRATAREKPHRLFLQSVEVADFAVGAGSGAPMPGTVGALGADAPFFSWLTQGGLAGNPAALPPGIAQPDEIEQRAMRLAESESGAINEDARLEIARELQRLAQENVWTINVFSPGPEPVIVKDTLQNVPRNATAAFEIGTPFNAFPETWFWKNPATINGVDPAPPAYLKDREATILATLGSNVSSREDRAEPPAASGRLVGRVFLGLALLVLALAALRHPYLLRRLALMVPTLLVISIVVFVGVQLPPGSYLETVTDNLRQQGNSAAAQQEIERLQELYHLKDSLPVQYLRWMGFYWFGTFDEADKGILQGNLGRSMANGNRPVADLIGDRLLLTVVLSLGAILVHWFIALPIGVYSAVRQNSPADYALTVMGLIGMCIPDFIMALLAILAAKQLFGIVAIGLFSSQYAMQPYWDWPKFVDLLRHIWVPVLIIGTSSTAALTRIIRANLLDELRKPYVVTARAKGLTPLRLLFKYPFRLALNPFISSIGGIFPALVSGSAIVSIILSLPTTGPMLYDAVMLEDTYMAGSLLLCLSALSILGVLVSDLLLILLDPRIRFGGNSR
jgi:peptide/nickel transport system permease protein